MVSLVLGGKKDDYPHPEVNYDEFDAAVQAALNNEIETWCPVKKRMMKWIRTDKLKSHIKGDKCIIM